MRARSVVLVIVGLALIVHGGFQLRTQTWDTVTGRLDSCTSRPVRDDSGMHGFRRTCVVSWDQGGVHHTDSGIVLDDRYDVTPQEGAGIELRVSGGQAVLANTDMVAVVMVVGGVFVLLAALAPARVRRLTP